MSGWGMLHRATSINTPAETPRLASLQSSSERGDPHVASKKVTDVTIDPKLTD